MTEQSKAKLMARLRSRRQREGWVRIEVWVPAAMVGKVRQYVRKLTKADSAKAAVPVPPRCECDKPEIIVQGYAVGCGICGLDVRPPDQPGEAAK